MKAYGSQTSSKTSCSVYSFKAKECGSALWEDESTFRRRSDYTIVSSFRIIHDITLDDGIVALPMFIRPSRSTR